ncbi:TetR/AcrR family transcriptional regulator [Devosia sp.]|uniref:TetR/AcrR family transcriptional regulator n=1 Tax=Devosia sp. TaxID=1871048 RepID=UPI003A9019B9
MSDRKQQIISAATTLFLDEGVGVSTARIAKAAGVSNGTLFNVFATKQALIDAIYKNAKAAMFRSAPCFGEAPYNRSNLRANWDGYLGWAEKNPETRRVMHLLLDAGLASAQTQAEVYEIAAPYTAWTRRALEDGVIRGPSVSFIGQLTFFHLDLVINEGLDRAGEDLAFEMLCTSIGLTQ